MKTERGDTMSGMRIRGGRVLVAGAVAVAILASFPLSALSYPRPGRTERVSMASGGAEANNHSFLMSVSADGRYVAFISSASNLVPGDTNEVEDLFVHDRETGTTERVSVASDGTQGNEQTSGTYGFPSMSADGRYVAFWSYATNLVPEDTNNLRDVFVHDRVTGRTERVSVASNGAEANLESGAPSISADGRYVVFDSLATNVVPGDNNGTWDIFVHDRVTGTTKLVSVGTNGEQGNAGAAPPRQLAVSADGRHVAFSGFASNLVPADTNVAGDVFVRDRMTGTTERVSVASDGAEGNSHSALPSMSADGRYVTFESIASNLVPGDNNGTWDIFVHDRMTGVTERVSVASDGAEANNLSIFFAIGPDARHVAFWSYATNLVPGDTNGFTDVFVRDRGRPVGVGELSAAREGDRISVSGWATFAGATVASASDPPDDGAEDANEVGAELTGADLVYRPEREDLLLRLRLSSLPKILQTCLIVACVRAVAPAVLYGLRFEHGGTDYEVRALDTGGTAVPPARPYFALYRCGVLQGHPSCTETARLTGGIGTIGTEVVVSVPLAALGAQEGATLTGIRAFTARGEAAPGALVALDQADLPDAAIARRSVTLGVAPAGTPEDGIVFDVPATLTNGDFSGTLDVSSLPPGEYEVWARACLGEDCGAASVRWMHVGGGGL